MCSVGVKVVWMWLVMVSWFVLKSMLLMLLSEVFDINLMKSCCGLVGGGDDVI